MYAVLICLVLAACAAACVENGSGKMVDGRCEILYCDPGHTPAAGECVPCERGFYSDAQSLEPCSPCPRIPAHADATHYGESSPDCLYRCHPNTFGQGCQSFFAVVWPVGFIVIVVGALFVLVRRQNGRQKYR